MSRSASQQALQGDLQRLERLLRRVAAPAAAAARSPRRILNLACGECHESGILARVFGSPSRELEFIGVDVRGPELQRARDRDASRPEGAFRYLEADASRLRAEAACREPFDVVFLRHQNYWHAPEIWKSIFDEGLQRLAPDGRLILTSYFEREHHLALEALENQGAELIVDARHEEARLLSPHLSKFVDRRVAVLRRPS